MWGLHTGEAYHRVLANIRALKLGYYLPIPSSASPPPNWFFRLRQAGNAAVVVFTSHSTRKSNIARQSRIATDPFAHQSKFDIRKSQPRRPRTLQTCGFETSSICVWDLNVERLMNKLFPIQVCQVASKHIIALNSYACSFPKRHSMFFAKGH